MMNICNFIKQTSSGVELLFGNEPDCKRFNRTDLSIDMLMKFMVTDVPKRAACGTLQERLAQFYADRKLAAPG